jgi:MFS family permease
LRFFAARSSWCSSTARSRSAIAGQAAVLKAGFRSVAMTGMALMGAGSVVLTQVSVRGGYFPDVFFGLLLCGLGIGLAFVTATVVALAGVAKHEAGLASGLSNTALQIGTALGVAIVTTVAISRSRDYLAANKGANPLVVLTEGYRYAFLACGKQRTGCRSRSRRPVPGTEQRRTSAEKHRGDGVLLPGSTPVLTTRAARGGS